jgi:Cu+-exporting ATPase
LQKADTLVVDKTGTLTEGKPRVVGVDVLADVTADEIRRLAAAIERGSEHPLAAAVVKDAEERGLAPAEVRDFRSVPGKGVTGEVEGHRVVIGTPVLLREMGIASSSVLSPSVATGSSPPSRLVGQGRGGAGRGQNLEGQTILFVALDGRLVGQIAVADPIRQSTPEAIRMLHEDGLRIIMLTGDTRTTAQAVGRQLGIDEVMAEVLPQEKNSAVKRLQDQGRIVVMAGDGINDAPALAQANVGIALGTGTDIAMESAAVILVKGDLRGIARARRLSRLTMRAIKQNLFLAFFYNAVSIPAAALGVLSPIWASVAMSLSSLSVVGNSLRLRKQKL